MKYGETWQAIVECQNKGSSVCAEPQSSGANKLKQQWKGKGREGRIGKGKEREEDEEGRGRKRRG